jgi:hypothetical protein
MLFALHIQLLHSFLVARIHTVSLIPYLEHYEPYSAHILLARLIPLIDSSRDWSRAVVVHVVVQ